MTKLFISDAGYSVGYGHYYRTKSVVSYLKKIDDDIHFYVNRAGSDIDLEYPDGYVDVEGEDVLRVANKINARTIYFDGHIDQKYLMNSNAKEDCDIINYQNLSGNVCPSVYISPYREDPRIHKYSISSSYETYEGLDFFIIRDMVRKMGRKKKECQGSDTIAFIAGGSDPNRFTEDFCKSVKDSQERNVKVSIYVGSHMLDERVKNIRDMYEGGNIVIRPFELTALLDSSLVVAPLSVTAFELLYLNQAVSVFNLPKQLTLDHIFSGAPPFYNLDDVSLSFEDSIKHLIENMSQVVDRTLSVLHPFSELDGLAHERIAEIVAPHHAG